jgi:hypothetical protein
MTPVIRSLAVFDQRRSGGGDDQFRLLRIVQPVERAAPGQATLQV